MALHVLDEANRCLGCKKPLCQQGCPIHTNIPEVIRLLKANQMDEAGKMLFENNPMTTVCALVCNHENQCEGHCVRNRMPSHDPVHFSIIEDYISTTYANKMTAGPAPKNGMKAAVVGSGPAGLTIAVLLARWGYDVTIFDARDKIGGVMRYGIPNYRLPDSVLDDFQYRHLELKGIKVRPNTTIGKTITIDDLFRDSYKSVFIGAGLWKANAMHIKGETLGNVAFGIDYLEAEERVIRELQELGKPFVVLVNSLHPEEARPLAEELQQKYGVRCLAVNCLELGEGDLQEILRSLLYEFPVQELQLFFPEWVEALPPEHPIPAGLYHAVGQEARRLEHVRQLESCMAALEQSEQIRSATLRQMDLGTGVGQVEVQLPRSLFYDTVNQQTGLSITDDGDLMEQLVTLAGLRKEYDRVAQAVSSARSTGYGVVMPSVEELELEDPEIVRQGGRYGVRMRASAPSIHMLRADVSTTVSPIVGNEKQSQDMVNYLLQEFEGEPGKLWESNIFGRSFHEIVGEDLQAKLKRMPEDSQKKLREALERILNEGSGGLICIIL